MTTIDTLLTWANERGYQRGIADGLDGFYNEAPLSGEFAGESIEELLGDVIRRVERMNGSGDDFYEIYNEILDSYEKGYRDAHFDKEEQAV